MALTPKVVETLHEQVKTLLDLWMRIRLVFVKSFGSQEITEDQEKAYLELKSEIQRLHRQVSDELTPGLKFDGDKMMETLKNAISMEVLRQQTVAERQKYLSVWHDIYIKLTRSVGALEVINAGYYPHEHRALIKSFKKDKA